MFDKVIAVALVSAFYAALALVFSATVLGERRRVARDNNVSLNQQGGFYTRGQSYDYNKKLDVAADVRVAVQNSAAPNISKLAADNRCSRVFVRKIIEELNTHGRVLRPEESFANREGPVGPGSRSMDEIDQTVLLFLYLEEPSRNLRNYVSMLAQITGTVVSESTVSRFFNHGFSVKGGLCRPNLVPFDKFRPENIERAYEYLEIIATIAPHRLKFGDEKHLKGKEVFNRQVRRNVLDGSIPPMSVPPDFTNTYNLTGFCSIVPTMTGTAVWCSIHESTNDADQFSLELEYAIQSGFLVGGDVLVLDNAAVHTGKENTELEDYLWNTYGIFLIFLPARTPEWNPIEQVWKCLVQRLRSEDTAPLGVIRQIGQHATAKTAINILSSITYDEVRRFYVGSGIIQD
jgi:hypothetical protein